MKSFDFWLLVFIWTVCVVISPLNHGDICFGLFIAFLCTWIIDPTHENCPYCEHNKEAHDCDEPYDPNETCSCCDSSCEIDDPDMDFVDNIDPNLRVSAENSSIGNTLPDTNDVVDGHIHFLDEGGDTVTIMKWNALSKQWINVGSYDNS